MVLILHYFLHTHCIYIYSVEVTHTCSCIFMCFISTYVHYWLLPCTYTRFGETSDEYKLIRWTIEKSVNMHKHASQRLWLCMLEINLEDDLSHTRRGTHTKWQILLFNFLIIVAEILKPKMWPNRVHMLPLTLNQACFMVHNS